jgi:flagellar hook assembly protein FlgD
MGQKVKTLTNKEITSGYHVLQWDGTNDRGSMVSTGMYFYTLQTNKYHSMRKMLFLK